MKGMDSQANTAITGGDQTSGCVSLFRHEGDPVPTCFVSIPQVSTTDTSPRGVDFAS
ncbi:hypothetical protein QQG74_14385 [Micromonospora sp. FIMYZ51]|uniref:hypothetical protein n=1 Tax=Micromonospora sp. FIMYZ51 TaxID=3051832 RepID=UPI0031203D40